MICAGTMSSRAGATKRIHEIKNPVCCTEHLREGRYNPVLSNPNHPMRNKERRKERDP